MNTLQLLSFVFIRTTPWCFSLFFCSVNSSLLPSSLIHPTALSVCWAGIFPFPSRLHEPCLHPSIHPSITFHYIKSPSFHTSGSLLCWWVQSPTQDVWACSSPPLLLLRCSLAPSLNGAPSPRQRGRAAHGPQSPFSQSRGTTDSTMSLGENNAEMPYSVKKRTSTSSTSQTRNVNWFVNSPNPFLHSACLCNVSLTCDGVGEVLVPGLPKQPDQSRHSITVLDSDLVVWIFAKRDVL